jgi:hypothetical protein
LHPEPEESVIYPATSIVACFECRRK